MYILLLLQRLLQQMIKKIIIIHTTALLKSTEKSPKDLRGLVVTQTLVQDHRLTLMWKINKESNNNVL